MIPTNNPNLALIGNGEFSFAKGARTVAEAQVIGWRDFGNLTTFSIDSSSDAKEHMGAYRGQTIRDRTRRSGLKLGYKFTADEVSGLTLALALMGDETGSYTSQGASAAVAGTPLVFSGGAPSVAGRFYDVLAADGTRVRDLAAITFQGTTLVENTDYEVDRKLGRVRFLTARTATVTPLITALGIAAAGVGSFQRINPLKTGIQRGLGRLVCFDDDDRNNVKLLHENFGCEVAVDSATDVKTDDWAGLSIMVTLGLPRGEVFSRD